MQTTQQTRLAPWSALAWVLVLYLALNFLVIFVLFPSGLLRAISSPTHGLISSTLVANVLMLVVVAGFLRLSSGLRLGDMGLRRHGLGVAAGVTFLVWIALNLFQATYALVTAAPLIVNPDWGTAGPTRTIGMFLGQILGNALFEEVLFRGILFQQMRLHFLARGGCSPKKALLLALVISSAVFAAIHVPLRISSGVPLAALPAELTLLFALGLLLALLYWRTGNLYLVIGVHALSNAPFLLVQQQVDLSTNGGITVIASLVLMLLWRRPATWSSTPLSFAAPEPDG
ncbi:CPBP family intramembrane glutamic endopeptidase [Luteimonas salinilitoris]|uniref:Lysostaphin resistance A-like protein n=1 Tax=Luteimonas salinilitoris TaxID=3237697 RepID=A0ABV4HTQ7_9GAMM